MPPGDDEPTQPPLVRICPDCRVEMAIPHRGHYVTLYVCPQCGAGLTIPPKVHPSLK